MRLLAATAALALLLTGCSAQPASPAPADSVTATPSPTSPAIDAASVLRDGFWRVEAAGETASTRVRFGTISVDVFRPHGVVLGELATRGDQLLTMTTGWSSALGEHHLVPWLQSAASVRRDGDGVRLLDVEGRSVARLVRADAPPRSRAFETDPTPPDPPPSPAVTPGPSARPVAEPAFTGTWRLTGRTDADLVLSPDGSWTTDTSCASGTGAAGGAGRWRVLTDGALLVVEGGVITIGCAAAPTDVAGARAISGFGQAGSLGLDAGRLTVYDRSGAPLGTLIR